MDIKKNSLLVLLILLISSCQVEENCDKDKEAKDAKCEVNPSPSDPVREPGSETPLPTEPPSTPGEEPVDLVSLSQYISNSVDDNQNSDQLSKGRSGDFNVDSCHQAIIGMDQFSDSIAYSVSELSKPRVVQLQSLGSIFGYSSNSLSYEEISLTSHSLCEVTKSSLKHTIAGRAIPDSTTIALAQRFSNDHNKFRKQALNGDPAGTEEIHKLWGKFFGCLAYTESLTTADTSSSRSIASRVAPSSYTKPDGVKFYIDPAQSQASKLNIGLFQFTPTYSGNINPCVKQWNKDYPSCKITDLSTNNMINVLGSAKQHFNAYCGVHKLLQTFFVQSHTSQTKRTHPYNFSSGSIKSPSNRCVSPFFRTAYNHFGPLQNTTGTNMKKIMSCVYK